MDQVLLLACTAAFNPTLLAAVTVMLDLDRPRRLLLGYLIGAAMTSVTIGLVIVFALDGSSTVTETVRYTFDPIFNLAVGALILTGAVVVATGHDRPLRERRDRRRAARKDPPPPRWKRALSRGTARTTFVIGALLTLPGASYLAGLNLIAKQELGTAVAVLTVLGFNAIMLLLLEIPLLGYTLSPEKTTARVARFHAWLARDGGHVALIAAFVIGAAFLLRGVGALL